MYVSFNVGSITVEGHPVTGGYKTYITVYEHCRGDAYLANESENKKILWGILPLLLSSQ